MVPLVHVAVACGIVSEVTIQFKLNVTCLHVPSNNIKFTSIIMIDNEKQSFFQTFYKIHNWLGEFWKGLQFTKKLLVIIKDRRWNLLIYCCFGGFKLLTVTFLTVRVEPIFAFTSGLIWPILIWVDDTLSIHTVIFFVVERTAIAKI